MTETPGRAGLAHRRSAVMIPRSPGFRIFLTTLAVVLFATSPTFAQPAGVTRVGTVEGITEYRLANGLRILLIPDASQPKVTVNITILCGSRHEGYGETGMAHLLEHMVFKGCPKFPDVPKALRDHGATFNGTTWVDRTNYFETMPAGDENLEFGIELEADRLVNSFIKRDDLLSEFTVVRNEFEAGENNPQSILFQRMLSAAYQWHNYGKSTIGNRSDIERVPIDNLQAFYKKYYRPDNAVLIVAGKFDEKKALELIAKHFGPLKKPVDPLPKTYTEEPPQDGERFVTLRRVGTVGAVGAVYHIPAASHPDYAACDALEQALTTNPSGRLYKALVEAKKASSVTGMSVATHDPGALIFLAQTEPENTEDARAALIYTLENLQAQPITDEEVDRVKAEFRTGREQLFANSQRLAIQFSEWAGAGDWKLFFLHRDRMEKVTAADVNRVAKQYLVRSNRTLGVYVPTKAAERAAVPPPPNVADLVKDYKGRDAVAAGEEFDPTPENIEKRVTRGSVGDGIKTALLPKKTRGETVNITLNLRFGNEDALKGHVAATQFVGPMLTRGTKTKTRQQIKDELDKLGALLNTFSSAGSVSVRIQAKRSNLPAVLALLGEVLRQPSFPESEFEILKRETLERLKQGKTEPQMLAATALQRKLSPYPDEDVRYVPTIDESIARTEAVTLAQVKELYETMIGSAAGELAAVGDFDPDAAVKQLDGFLKGWSAKVPYKRIENPFKPTVGGVETILTPDKANAVYVAGIGFPITDSDPDYPALAIGNYVLGEAPLASRLSNRVRGKDGLSYGVMSMVQAAPLDKSGVFVSFAIANPTNLPKVDAAIAEEIKKFLDEGASAAELEEAKKGYLQNRKVTRSNDGGLAGQLASALHAGRTMAYEAEFEKKVSAVQPGDVKAAFNKHLTPKNLIVIHAGDFNKKDAPPEKKDEKK
jgi:zinc protease